MTTRIDQFPASAPGGPDSVNAWIVGDDEEVIVIDPGRRRGGPARRGGRPRGARGHLHARPRQPRRRRARGGRTGRGAGGPAPGDRSLWREAHPEEDADIEMEDGGVFEVADVRLEVIHAPGHTAGSVCLYCEDLGAVFTGHVLLAEGPAPQDGEFPDFAEQLNAIGEYLLTLPADTRVLPGHGRADHDRDGGEEVRLLGRGRVRPRPRRLRPGDPDGAAGLRGNAAAALHLHADPAVHLAGLPAPVPDELPGPAVAAQGPAVGAQQPRRQRAQRPGRLVAAAAGPAHGRGRGHPGRPRLDQRGLRGRDPVGAPARARHRHGGGLRRRTGPGRRAARRGTDGRDPHGHDRRLRPDRPPRLPETRARRGRLQDRTAPAHHRRRAQLDGPGPVRAGRRRGCCGGPATGWSCTTCPPAQILAWSHTDESLARHLRRAEDIAEEAPPPTSGCATACPPTATTRSSRPAPARPAPGATTGGTAPKAPKPPPPAAPGTASAPD